MKTTKSKTLYEKACKIIPGGVNSPVRAFKSVGGIPLFIKSAKASKIYDVDDNEYIDYVSSWGPHLFGHNPDFLINAIKDSIDYGTSYGAPTELEIKMAELICGLVPSVEMVRMVNSGTEATMSAVRLARAFTKKDKIIKFEGCYHGHGDYFLIKAGSGGMTFGIPTSPGVTRKNASDTLTATFNDLDSVKEVISNNKNEIAAVIIEPVAGNMGVIASEPDFLSGLREICSEESIILIFDEVITGFRLSAGGAQEIYNIYPDLTTFGKIIGGGLPVGAYGGRRDLMEMIAPIGPVYQAGTLSGNPLAMTAGIAMLNYIKEHPELYKELNKKSIRLTDGIREGLKTINKSYTLNSIGSMSTLFFTDKQVKDYDSAITSDIQLYGKFFHKLLNHGIYLAPSQFETMFVSVAHTNEEIDYTIKFITEILQSITKF
jgi:glutamate-1-semialdehyde 2,1-aminomutase